MKFIAEIDVMPHRELLDPQGKAVVKNMHNVDIHGVLYARIGKHILLTVEAASESEAHTMVDNACQKLLANPIMETYHFVLKAAQA